MLPPPPDLPDDFTPLRTCDADGSVHFSQLKTLALSGVQYLYACNNPIEPTRDMRIGTIVHFLLLGERPGMKPIVRYTGGRRYGREWDAFRAANQAAEIVTVAEWDEAERIAEAVRASPVAAARLANARTEVPLVWEENGIRCSTSGVDVLCTSGDIADLKTCPTTHPETWMRHAFRMLYPQQLAFYRRGARANGINVRGLYILGVERKAPYEVVELELTEGLAAFADRSVSLWLEKLRVYRESIPEPQTVRDWPGYAQSSMPWDVPTWMGEDDEDADEDDGEEAAA